jgi:hypothetical protein
MHAKIIYYKYSTLQMNLNLWAEHLSDPKKCLALFNTYLASNQYKDEIRQMIQQGFCPDLSGTDDKIIQTVKNLVCIFNEECLEWCNQLNLSPVTVSEMMTQKNPVQTTYQKIQEIIRGNYDGITVKTLVELTGNSWLGIEEEKNFMNQFSKILCDLGVSESEFLDELWNIDSHGVSLNSLSDKCIQYCLESDAPIDSHIDKFMSIYGPRMCHHFADGYLTYESNDWDFFRCLLKHVREYIDIQKVFELFLDENIEPFENEDTVDILWVFITNGLDVTIPHINDYIYNMMHKSYPSFAISLDHGHAETLFKALINGSVGDRKYEFFNFVLQWMEYSLEPYESEIPSWLADLEIDFVDVTKKYLDGEIKSNQHTMLCYIFPLVSLVNNP